MAKHEMSVREYLLPSPGTFWEWRDDGEVIAWKDGKTIAFREELRSILGWLAPQGLPPLDAVAMLLAATHETWNATGSEASSLEPILQATNHGAELMQEIMPRLTAVSRLESKLRAPVRSKAVLVEMSVGDCRRVMGADAALAVVDSMRRGMGEIVTPPSNYVDSGGFGPLLLARDLADLLQGLRKLTPEALAARLATGLEETPDAAELDLPPCELARAILDSLQDDLEFAGLARVAKLLLAVASLPRKLESEEQHHTGGFSDISNRGSIERLLVSELANDDLTLAVRVAMNEALYMRREVPPSTPHDHRLVLVDAGIRSWGVPRVFATAVALAFMASTAQRGAFSCFRAKRHSIETVDLATRGGIVEHLGALETDLHMAEALPAFVRRLEEEPDATEPILLMTEDALADRTMQLALRKLELEQLFVATVNRQGVFRLQEFGTRGSKVLREATIDLESLFRTAPKIVEKRWSQELPAIFGADPFPLLLPHRMKLDRMRYVEYWGVVSTPGDGRLMRWTQKGLAAVQLSDDVSGRILWSSPTAPNGHLTLVVGGSGNATLMRISLDNVVVDQVPLKLQSRGGKFCARNGALFLVHDDRVEVYDMHSGHRTETLRLPGGVRPVRDRFFVGPGDSSWHALTYDGQSARLELVKNSEPARKLPPLLTMFDQVGVDGPVGITRDDGHLISTAGGVVRRINHGVVGPYSVPWISADGQRVHLRSLTNMHRPHAPSQIVIDTKSLKYTPFYSEGEDDRILQLVHGHVSLRHRFAAIGLTAAGKLALESRRGQILVFNVKEGLPVLTVSNVDYRLAARQAFETMDGTGQRIELRRAQWPGGQRAFADTRGLLHLVSGDPRVPEVSLVLAEGEELSGWCADGRVWGKRFFVGDFRTCEETAAAQYAVYEATVARFAELIGA